MECVGSYKEMPEKSIHMYVYVVVNYLFYGDLEGLGYIYIYVSAWKKYTLGDIPTVDCRIASS